MLIDSAAPLSDLLGQIYVEHAPHFSLQPSGFLLNTTGVLQWTRGVSVSRWSVPPAAPFGPACRSVSVSPEHRAHASLRLIKVDLG